MRQRWWTLGIAAGLVLVPASAASAGGGDHAAPAGGGGHSLCAGFASGPTVFMRDNCFWGTAHFAEPGTITITNDGEQPHNLTVVDGGLATSDLAAGASETLTFADRGIYRVYCTIHGTASGEGMAGVLIVGEQSIPIVAAGGTGDTDEGSEWLVIAVAVGISVVLATALWLWARGTQRRQAGGAAEAA